MSTTIPHQYKRAFQLPSLPFSFLSSSKSFPATRYPVPPRLDRFIIRRLLHNSLLSSSHPSSINQATILRNGALHSWQPVRLFLLILLILSHLLHLLLWLVDVPNGSTTSKELLDSKPWLPSQCLGSNGLVADRRLSWVWHAWQRACSSVCPIPSQFRSDFNKKLPAGTHRRSCPRLSRSVALSSYHLHMYFGTYLPGGSSALTCSSSTGEVSKLGLKLKPTSTLLVSSPLRPPPSSLNRPFAPRSPRLLPSPLSQPLLSLQPPPSSPLHHQLQLGLPLLLFRPRSALFSPLPPPALPNVNGPLLHHPLRLLPHQYQHQLQPLRLFALRLR